MRRNSLEAGLDWRMSAALWWLGTALTPSVFAAVVPSTHAHAETAPQTTTMPVRKAGLWHIRTIAESFGTREIDACISPEDAIVPGPEGFKCAPARVKSGGQETIVTLECTKGAEHQVTSVLFTGDFATWYRGQSKLTITTDGGGNIPDTVGFTIYAQYVREKCDAAP